VGDLTWHRLEAPPEPTPAPIELIAEELPGLTALPVQRRLRVELDCQDSPAAVGEQPRPYLPWACLMADARTGFKTALAPLARALHAWLEHQSFLPMLAPAYASMREFFSEPPEQG
jgi:hypothetical protein